MEEKIIATIVSGILNLYGHEINESQVNIQDTRKEFEGNITVVVFPFLRFSGKSPERTAEDIGLYIKENLPELESFNIVKGFLNLLISDHSWMKVFSNMLTDYPATTETEGKEKTILIEYSSPNTNKPLHLGHIRNNLLGFSLSRIFEACGHRVIKTNIVNDRGIHICKSMLAWKYFGNDETPESSGLKGDHLVGKYYVRFDTEYKKQIDKLRESGKTDEDATESAALMTEAREMLRKWESGDNETIALWEKMNNWVYKGFDITYNLLGVSFDKIYYESDTYKLGRDIVEAGLNRSVFYKKADGSVWVALDKEGLDDKLLLRADGTAVYMTQDLGTAVERYNDYHFNDQYYVVGNEQNYHFHVLKIILDKLDYKWSSGIHHFSYGMVELPEGKMKSREGKVVDADDLIKEMVMTAREMSESLGKLDDYSDDERLDIYRKVGMGALKYYILKVDPRKNMLFDPKESIDFNGNTGPFIQYAYTRINSVLRKLNSINHNIDTDIIPKDKEIDLIRLLSKYGGIVSEAAASQNPALIANYCYDLAKEFNQFYHDYSILGEEDSALRDFRISLSEYTGNILKGGMYLLGIEMPERM